VHRFPHGSIDVDDDPGIGLVIFGPDRPFSKRGRSVAEDAAIEFLVRPLLSPCRPAAASPAAPRLPSQTIDAPCIRAVYGNPRSGTMARRSRSRSRRTPHGIPVGHVIRCAGLSV
jgi:hypothetical protein